jgi:hypothetical protein
MDRRSLAFFGLFLLMLLVNYCLFRVRPANAELDGYAGTATRLEQDLERARPPAPLPPALAQAHEEAARRVASAVGRQESARDLGPAEVQVEAARAALRELERETEALTQRAQELADSAAQAESTFAGAREGPELSLQLAALADSAVLVLVDRSATPPGSRPRLPGDDASALDLWSAADQVEAGARPAELWTVRGDFAALWTFLEGLAELPWQAAVVRLDVLAGDGDDPRLTVRMAVAR